MATWKKIEKLGFVKAVFLYGFTWGALTILFTNLFEIIFLWNFNFTNIFKIHSLLSDLFILIIGGPIYGVVYWFLNKRAYLKRLNSSRTQE